MVNSIIIHIYLEVKIILADNLEENSSEYVTLLGGNHQHRQVEDHTEEEQAEEHQFIEEMMRTVVMKTALQYLLDRGNLTYINIWPQFLPINNFQGVFSGTEEDWKDYLYKIWFSEFISTHLVFTN